MVKRLRMWYWWKMYTLHNPIPKLMLQNKKRRMKALVGRESDCNYNMISKGKTLSVFVSL